MAPRPLEDVPEEAAAAGQDDLMGGEVLLVRGGQGDVEQLAVIAELPES